MNDTYDTEPMSKDEIVDSLKAMVFGVQAFERFNAKERKTLDMAIEALEQEPLQVELEGDGYADGELVYDFGKCPNCGWEFEEGDKDWEEPYCCHCGQKLEWFDNEAEWSDEE